MLDVLSTHFGFGFNSGRHLGLYRCFFLGGWLGRSRFFSGGF